MKLRRGLDSGALSASAGLGRLSERGERLIDSLTGSRRVRRDGIAHQREYSVIVATVSVLVAYGLVMVLSASASRSGIALPLKTIVIVGTIGLVACFIGSRVDLDYLRRRSGRILAGACVLLAAVFVPGVGRSANGATRWLGPGVFSFQPSELVKVALVLFLAAKLLRHRDEIGNLIDLVRLVFWPVLILVALIMAQPDMGTAIVCIATAVSLCWLAGVSVTTMAALLTSFALVMGAAAIYAPYRMQRLTSFLDPGADPLGSGFQALQGKIAIGSGGITGVGPGQSVQKIFYLPEAHTDFILAVIGEELGLLGILALLACYSVLLVMGFSVARAATDPFAKLVAAGVTTLITCQALLNICVVLGIAPLTGVPLPFISYGPTSLVVLLGGVGLLLNVARDGEMRLKSFDGEGLEDDRDAGSDRGGRNGGARGPGVERRRRAIG